MNKCFLRFFILPFLAISFSCSSQTVSEILFEGVTKTKVSSLLRIIDCSVGTRIDSVLLQNDVDKLTRLPGIAAASFRVDSDSKVAFLVEENYSLIPYLNLWNADSLLAFQAGLYDVNFLGRNVSLGGFYQYNGLHTYGVSFMAPYIVKGRMGVEVNVQRWSSYEPLYFEERRLIYQFGFNATEALLLYRFDTRSSIKIGGSFFREMYMKHGDDLVDNSVFPEVVDLRKKLFKVEYEFNKVNYFYYLLKGLRNSFYFQAVKTIGVDEKPFLVAWNDFVYYKRYANEGNLALRLRLGLGSNRFSPFAPFALDNQKNIRGVGNIASRGTGTIIFNIEYRNTLLAKKWFRLQGNSFLDVGAFRVPGASIDSFVQYDNIDVYAGLGVRFIHKTVYNAVLRIDYGIGLTKENTNGFVIGVGQYF